MKVKIIQESTRWDLEDEVNKFLKNYKPGDIIDIKYSGSGSHNYHNVTYYSVMIILK